MIRRFGLNIIDPNECYIDDSNVIVMRIVGTYSAKTDRSMNEANDEAIRILKSEGNPILILADLSGMTNLPSDGLKAWYASSRRSTEDVPAPDRLAFVAKNNTRMNSLFKLVLHMLDKDKFKLFADMDAAHAWLLEP
jgi:hypothetical protein